VESEVIEEFEQVCGGCIPIMSQVVKGKEHFYQTREQFRIRALFLHVYGMNEGDLSECKPLTKFRRGGRAQGIRKLEIGMLDRSFCGNCQVAALTPSGEFLTQFCRSQVGGSRRVTILALLMSK
jgi:hypothetical protein